MNLNLYNDISTNISFTRVKSEIIMQPHQLNPQGSIHGGELMMIMDNIAGIVARKYSKGRVVTRRISDIEFIKPVQVGDIVTVIGQLIYVGNSSMEILVHIYVHDLNDYDNPELAVSAFVTMIHLVDSKPSKVPDLIIKSKEDEALYKIGKKLKEMRERIK